VEEMASPEELAKIKDDVPTLIDIVRTGKGDVLRVQAGALHSSTSQLNLSRV